MRVVAVVVIVGGFFFLLGVYFWKAYDRGVEGASAVKRRTGNLETLGVVTV